MPTTVEIALGYIARGWNPVPIPAREKGPRGKAWQTRSPDPARARLDFKEGMNVGVLLGPSSNNLLDCDLDCIEALRIAPYLMPRTSAIFGHSSKPNSHFLYYSIVAEAIGKGSLQFMDPMRPAESGMLLELRCGGGGRAAQTVFPGSIHPSGEAIRWDVEGEPGRVAIEWLINGARHTAAASLFARYWPEHGKRHNARLCLGGVLARAGITLEHAKLFAEAVIIGAGLPRDKVENAVRTVADVWNSFKNGSQTVYGYPQLSEQFGEKVAKRIASLLGYECNTAANDADESKSYHVDDRGFKCNKNGNPIRTHENVRIAIKRLDITIRHNEFSNQSEINGLPPFADGELTDFKATRLRFMIDEQFKFLIAMDLFQEILVDLAYLAPYHPVRNYIKGLVWDGVPRIAMWLIEHAGAENTPYVQAVSRLWLIAGVRRIMKPGCKFDTLMTWHSPQGRNKSTAARIMAVKDEWFTDCMPIGADAKEVIEQIAGIWIAEFPELEGMGDRELDHIKAFLSRQEDRARPAYGRRRESMPRQFIGVGSVNNPKFLREEENRRWWPVRIVRFNIEDLLVERDQLWAEAAFYEAQGEKLELPEELWSIAAEEQEKARVDNPFTDQIRRCVGDSEGWVLAADFWDMTRTPVDRRSTQLVKMGRALRELGFKSADVKSRNDPRGPRNTRYYWRGDDTMKEVRLNYKIEDGDIPY